MTPADNIIVAVCERAYAELQAIYVFGSQARGQARADSDWDIAVLLAPAAAVRAGTLTLSALHQALERRLGAAVDVINLRRASTVFAREIIAEGRRIHARDAFQADTFEALTFTLYQELNVERAVILEAIERTGDVYAP